VLLSAALITRDANAADLSAAIVSIRPLVDEIVLVDTGSREIAAPEGVDKFLTYSGCNDRHGQMIDFAAARNFSFSECRGDFITWMDSDDVVTVKTGGQNVLREACTPKTRTFFPYDYAEGQAFPLPRIVPRGAPWTYPIHELLIAEDLSDAFRHDVTWTHKRKTREETARASSRNLRITEHWQAQYKKDPRFLYYAGQSYATQASFLHAEGKLELSQQHRNQAITSFTRSFELQGDTEHAFSAAQRLFYLSLPNYPEAARWAWRATETKPSWPHGYYLLGRAYYHLSADVPSKSLEYAKLSALYFEMGMQMPPAQSILFVHEEEGSFDIHRYYNVVLFKMGRIADALKSCETGIGKAPYPQLLQNRDLYRQKLGRLALEP
jgi:glycosyltransferase involved in cell wall biosynthesis